MRVLITGGAGFIGSHLAEFYAKNGQEVIIVDDLSTGSKENVLGLENSPLVKVFFDTVENLSLLESCLSQVDFVFHLAGAVGVKKIIEDPIGSIKRNITCAEIVLESAHKFQKPVLIASTSEVYGKSAKESFSEADDLCFSSPTKLRWNYACSKAIDEFLSLAYYKHKNLPVIVTRFFNVVGPRQSQAYGMVIPRFMEQAMKNEDLTIFGDGHQTRCFCHVADIVEGLSKLVLKDEAYGQIFNLGNDEEISILNLAKKIIKITASTSRIINIPYSEVYNSNGAFEDIMRRRPNIDKIKTLTGFCPKRTLDNILSEVRDYFLSKQNVVKDEKAA